MYLLNQELIRLIILVACNTHHTLLLSLHDAVDRRAWLELKLIFLDPDGVRAVVHVNEAVFGAKPHGGLMVLRIVAAHLGGK